MGGVVRMMEHFQKIKEVVRAAEADGFDVTIENECCGCSRMTLEISAKDDTNGIGGLVLLGERSPV